MVHKQKPFYWRILKQTSIFSVFILIFYVVRNNDLTYVLEIANVNGVLNVKLIEIYKWNTRKVSFFLTF